MRLYRFFGGVHHLSSLGLLDEKVILFFPIRRSGGLIFRLFSAESIHNLKPFLNAASFRAKSSFLSSCAAFDALTASASPVKVSYGSSGAFGRRSAVIRSCSAFVRALAAFSILFIVSSVFETVPFTFDLISGILDILSAVRMLWAVRSLPLQQLQQRPDPNRQVG